MSSTNRGTKRQDADYYPTPEWSVLSFLRTWNPYQRYGRTNYLEPCAGDGAIIRGVSNFYQARNLHLPSWTAIELRPDAIRQRTLYEPEVTWIQPQDFLTYEHHWNKLDRVKEKPFSVCLTNPPFELAMPFIQKAISLCDVVVMLLRLDFLGTHERAEWHARNPADLYKLRRRPAFINGKTDSCEYAWFVWGEEGGRWFMLDE